MQFTKINWEDIKTKYTNNLEMDSTSYKNKVMLMLEKICLKSFYGLKKQH